MNLELNDSINFQCDSKTNFVSMKAQLTRILLHIFTLAALSTPYAIAGPTFGEVRKNNFLAVNFLAV